MLLAPLMVGGRDLDGLGVVPLAFLDPQAAGHLLNEVVPHIELARLLSAYIQKYLLLCQRTDNDLRRPMHKLTGASDVLSSPGKPIHDRQDKLIHEVVAHQDMHVSAQVLAHYVVFNDAVWV